MRNEKTILVVEDDRLIRRVIALKLSAAGYCVLKASDGREGLERVRTERPDVVITDINMPELDGRTLCKMTNGLKAERRFLTVVLSGGALPDEQAWIAALKDTVFLPKPFSPSHLLELVDSYTGETDEE